MSKLSPKTKIVYQYLQELVSANELSPGDQIPTENELADKFGLSRPTITKAVNLFVEEGFAYRKSGIGTFIKSKGETGKHKKMIGLLFPLIGKGEIFRPITEELAKLSEKLNFSLIWGGQFSNSEISSQQMEQMVDFYIEQKVDGILMAPIELTRECLSINKIIVEKIENAGIPIVLVDGEYFEFPKRSKYDLVGIDNFRAGYISAMHYIEQGEKRVDFLRTPFIAQTIPQRIMGYRQALIDNNITPSSDWIHSVDDFTESSLQRIVDSGAVNIICGNDDLAMKLIRGLTAIGVDIPDSIRVSGFDDLEFASYLTIPLTTIAQPCRELAEVIIYTMLRRIKSPALPGRSVMLDFELKIRESSRIIR